MRQLSYPYLYMHIHIRLHAFEYFEKILWFFHVNEIRVSETHLIGFKV